MTHFYTPPCLQVSAFDQPPSHCGRPHLASDTVLWSDSVIAGAVKIRCSLILTPSYVESVSGSLRLKRTSSLSHGKKSSLLTSLNSFALVEAITLNRRVVGSTPALAVT